MNSPRAAFGVTPLGEGGTPLDRRSRIFGCSGLGHFAPERAAFGSAIRAQRSARRSEGWLA
jgi:hypothetical protein